MRCPHCRNRAMGLLAWLGHVVYQPLWKAERYHTTCTVCSARLRPTGQERIANVAMPLLGGGVGIAAFAVVDLASYRVWFVLLGVLAGIVAQYPLARYQLADPGQVAEVPLARSTDRSEE